MWQDIHATFYCGTQEVTGHSSIWQQDITILSESQAVEENKFSLHCFIWNFKATSLMIITWQSYSFNITGFPSYKFHLNNIY